MQKRNLRPRGKALKAQKTRQTSLKKAMRTETCWIWTRLVDPALWRFCCRNLTTLTFLTWLGTTRVSVDVAAVTSHLTWPSLSCQNWYPSRGGTARRAWRERQRTLCLCPRSTRTKTRAPQRRCASSAVEVGPASRSGPRPIKTTSRKLASKVSSSKLATPLSALPSWSALAGFRSLSPTPRTESRLYRRGPRSRVGPKGSRIAPDAFRLLSPTPHRESRSYRRRANGRLLPKSSRTAPGAFRFPRWAIWKFRLEPEILRSWAAGSVVVKAAVLSVRYPPWSTCNSLLEERRVRYSWIQRPRRLPVATKS